MRRFAGCVGPRTAVAHSYSVAGCGFAHGLGQGSGVISTMPPGTTAIRNSFPASSRIPDSAQLSRLIR